MSVVVTDPFAAMRAEIELAGQRGDVPAEEKLAQLREIADDLTDLQGLVARYRGDLFLEQESRTPAVQEAILELREGAMIRDRMLAREAFTPEELDEFGLLSHDDIDKLDEEGLLEAWVEESFADIIFDPAKHPRGGHGRFAATLGRVVARGRGGKAVKLPKPPAAPRPVRDVGSDAGAAARGTERSAERAAPAAKQEGERAAAEVKRETEKLHKEAVAVGLDGKVKPGPEAQRILHGMPDTQQLHQVRVRGAQPTTQYTPERKVLHDRIIDTLLRERMEVANARGEAEHAPNPNGQFLAPPTEGAPRVLFMAGGTASGKTSVLGAVPDATPQGAVHIDPDEIKSMLPEFVQMVKAKDAFAAQATHEESSDIAKRLFATAKEKGLNIVLDGTGDSKAGTFAGKIEDAHAAGYEPHVLYVTAPTEVALERAMARAAKTLRYVPEPEVRAQHKNVSARFPEIKQLVDKGVVKGIKMFDTRDTGNPTLFASGGNGSFEVHDPKLLSEFEGKAHEEGEAR